MSTDPRFAEPTPFARLVYAQAAGACGDAAITVSMAGSLFFSSPTSAARGKVLLYLLITMAPFCSIAPGARPGARPHEGWAPALLISSAAGRAVLCLAMAHVHQQAGARGAARLPARVRRAGAREGLSRSPRARSCPPLVNDDGELVNANSRLALINASAAFVGARTRVRGVQQLFGADWSLRFGAVVFVVATILAIQIPRTRLREPADEQRAAARAGRDAHPEHPARFERVRRAAGERRLPRVLRRVLAQGRSRRARAPRASAASSATSVGVLVAPRLRRSVREEVILASSLVLPAIFTLLGALVAGSVGFVLAAFAIGIGAAAGRLGFDSLLQRDGPDAVRGPGVRQVRDPLPARVGDRRRDRHHPVRQADGPVPPRHRARVRGDLLRRRAAGRARPGDAHEAPARGGRPHASRRPRPGAGPGEAPLPQAGPAHAAIPAPPEPEPLGATGPAARRALHHAERADRPAEAVDHQRVDLLACRDALVDDRVAPPGSSRCTRGWRRSPTCRRGVADDDRVLAARGRELDDRRRRSRRWCRGRARSRPGASPAGGDAQCQPITSSGRSCAAAICPIGKPDVFDARIVPAGAAASRSRNTCCLSSSFSGTASITRSTLRGFVERRGEREARRAASASSRVSLPRSTPRSNP